MCLVLMSYLNALSRVCPSSSLQIHELNILHFIFTVTALLFVQSPVPLSSVDGEDLFVTYISIYIWRPVTFLLKLLVSLFASKGEALFQRLLHWNRTTLTESTIFRDSKHVDTSHCIALLFLGRSTA